MTNPFIGIFDSLADFKARNLFFKEAVTDLIYDTYYSKFKNKSVFRGIILSGYVDSNATVGDPPEDVDPSTFSLKYKIRPLDIHDVILESPLDIMESETDSFIKFKNLVRLHPFGYPETDASNNAKEQYVYGDIVTFRFEEGPASNGRLRSIRIIDRVEDYQGNLPFKESTGIISTELSAKDTLDNGGAKTAADFRTEQESDDRNSTSGAAGTDRVSWRARQGVVLNTKIQNQFIARLCKDLKKVPGWTKEVVVNSTFRTPEQQMAAIISQVTANTISWYDTKYNSFKYKPQVRAILESNKSRDEKILAGSAWIRKAMGENNYMSAHLYESAFDLRTLDYTYEEGIQFLETVRRNKYVRSAIWENVTDSLGKKKGNDRKRQKGQQIPNEHVHLSLTSTGGE